MKLKDEDADNMARFDGIMSCTDPQSIVLSNQDVAIYRASGQLDGTMFC